MDRPFGSARPRVPVHRWTCRASMRVSPGKKFWIWCARVVDRSVGSCPRAARRTNPRTAESGRRDAKVLPSIPPRRKKTVPDTVSRHRFPYFSPRWSPDGKKIAYVDNHQGIWYVDLDQKQRVKVDRDYYWVWSIAPDETT